MPETGFAEVTIPGFRELTWGTLTEQGTVLDNIGYGRGDRTTSQNELTRKEVEHAARLADMHRFVSYLPAQYDTVLGGDSGMKPTLVVMATQTPRI